MLIALYFLMHAQTIEGWIEPKENSNFLNLHVELSNIGL